MKQRVEVSILQKTKKIDKPLDKLTGRLIERRFNFIKIEMKMGMQQHIPRKHKEL